MTEPAPDLRVLVADDESPARQRIVDRLHGDPRIARVWEAADGAGAVETILRERIDLVFLDMQMPELTGMEVIERVGIHRMPLTIFVTAYDHHAIRAFEANALDYLLKPYSDERFEAALVRAVARKDALQLHAFGENVRRMLAAAPTNERFLDRFVTKSRGTTVLVRVEDVDWIEADGVYVTLHAGAHRQLYRASLTDLAGRLDPMRFVRIHRSSIVNIDAIVRLEALSHGEFDVVFKSGSRTRVSRTYRSALERRLGQTL